MSFVLCLFILILLTELETRRRGQEDLARANRALADNEARYRLLADNTTDVIARVGLDGTLRYLSPSCVAVTGFAPEELVGRKSSSLIHPDDRPHVEEHFRRLIAAGPEAPRTSLAFRARHKDGSWTWLEINPTVLVDPATGAPFEFIDVVRNISRRKEIEAELRQKTSLLEATLEHMDQGLVMIDSPRHRCGEQPARASSFSTCRSTSWPRSRATSRSGAARSPRANTRRSDQAFQDWIAGGGLVPAQQTYERIRPNGTALEVRTVPLADGGVVRTYSDITYRKRAEQALTRSEARFRLLAENASDIIMLQEARRAAHLCVPGLPGGAGLQPRGLPRHAPRGRHPPGRSPPDPGDLRRAQPAAADDHRHAPAQAPRRALGLGRGGVPPDRGRRPCRPCWWRSAT